MARVAFDASSWVTAVASELGFPLPITLSPVVTALVENLEFFFDVFTDPTPYLLPENPEIVVYMENGVEIGRQSLLEILRFGLSLESPAELVVHQLQAYAKSKKVTQFFHVLPETLCRLIDIRGCYYHKLYRGETEEAAKLAGTGYQSLWWNTAEHKVTCGCSSA